MDALTEHFKTNADCKAFLRKSRWTDGDIVCPYCGHHHCYSRSDGRFRCPHCLGNFSVLTGTIMDNTKIALRKWFMAMYLLANHKKGISSHQLSRDLSVTQKTAWYILQRSAPSTLRK